jgi:predicted transcriptional regulator
MIHAHGLEPLIGTRKSIFMPRPRHEQPTPAELDVLKILWHRNRPASVRDVFEVVNRDSRAPRAYTSVMSLLNVMTDKGLLRRAPQGRAFIYEPSSPRDATLGSMLAETLNRVYDGSASLLVAHLLDQSHLTGNELEQIRSLLDAYQTRRARVPRKVERSRDPARAKHTRG